MNDIGEQKPRLRLVSVNTAVAFLLGMLLLAISYWGVHEMEFWRDIYP
jgi:hypothetical protein